jgi:malate dehydrogenase (oxaloacetate-decarboxylating)
MRAEGLTDEQARRRIWLVDSQGLVHAGRTDLDAFKLEYAQPRESAPLSLLEVVRRVHPTILIGTAAQPQAFTEDIVREMSRHVARPIVFPLSNPTSKSEALPTDVIAWSEGGANLPGVGLGVIASKARRVTDAMFVAAARELSEMSPARCRRGGNAGAARRPRRPSAAGRTAAADRSDDVDP